MAELQAALSEKEAEIRRLKEELEASTAEQEEAVTQVSLKGMLLVFFSISPSKSFRLYFWFYVRLTGSSIVLLLLCFKFFITDVCFSFMLRSGWRRSLQEGGVEMFAFVQFLASIQKSYVSFIYTA